MALSTTFFANKQWLLKTPKTLREHTVKEACLARKACFQNLRNGNIKSFDLQFRSKMKQVANGWSICIDKKQVFKKDRELVILKHTLGNMRFASRKELNRVIEGTHPPSECKIQKDKYGDYYLVVTVSKKVAKKRKTQRVVSVDPGIRKFITTYSPNSQDAWMIARNYGAVIMPLLKQLDSLLSIESKLKGKTLSQHHKKVVNLRRKIFYKKKDLIEQSSSMLVKNYDIILLPKLDVLKLSEKKKRQLKTKTVRQMLSMGHSEFFNRTQQKAIDNGVVVLPVKEHYTSQTCPCCGHRNKCNEVYKCKTCCFENDRDIVGALNILLKAVRTNNPRCASSCH